MKKPNVIEISVACISQGQDSVYLNTFAKGFLFASVLRSPWRHSIHPSTHWCYMSLYHGENVSTLYCPGVDDCHRLERGRKSSLSVCTAPAAVSALCQSNKTLGYAHIYKVKWLISDLCLNETSPYFPKFGNMLFTLNQGRFWPSIIASQEAAMTKKTPYQRRGISFASIDWVALISLILNRMNYLSHQ